VAAPTERRSSRPAGRPAAPRPQTSSTRRAKPSASGGSSGPASPPFTGFPVTALDFYDDLEVDNSKTFWDAHKDVYTAAVRKPMVALTDALEAEFGVAKVFRPYRDVRFAGDKTPYKTHQGAFVAVAPATGWYVEISAPGVRVAGGFYHASSAGISAVRAAIDGPEGVGLEKILARLRRAGFEVGGERLKTTPRGYPADHPRIELLRHKSLTASRNYGFDQMIHAPELLTQVRKDWRAVRSLVEWLAPRLEGTAEH
jgi:uncharacterized protein (TIGR02453 family)